LLSAKGWLALRSPNQTSKKVPIFYASIPKLLSWQKTKKKEASRKAMHRRIGHASSLPLRDPRPISWDGSHFVFVITADRSEPEKKLVDEQSSW
jgi:hypothetical protein